MKRAGHQFLAGATLTPHQHTTAGPTDARDLGLEILHRLTVTDEFVEDGVLFYQSLVICLQAGLPACADQRDTHDIGQRDRDFEVALTELTLLVVDMDRAQRVGIGNQRHAECIRVVA